MPDYAIKMLKNQTKIRHTPDFSFKEIICSQE